MDKLGGTGTFVICLLTISLFTLGDEAQPNMEEQPRKPTFLDMITSMFSFPTTATSSYCEKAKSLLNQAHAYFFPPNLEGSDEAAEGNGGGEGAGEKVKEAVSKSLGKSKAAVEDSAKSAANLAGETMHKTAEKVRKSFSERDGDSQAEL